MYVSAPPSELDANLLQRVAAGDTVSFALLYDQFCALTYGLFLKRHGDVRVVDEAMCTFWLGVWSNAALLCRRSGSAESILLSLAEPIEKSTTT